MHLPCCLPHSNTAFLPESLHSLSNHSLPGMSFYHLQNFHHISHRETYQHSSRMAFPCLQSFSVEFSSVQFSRSVVSNSSRPHESQHARPPCPSPTPGVTQTYVHRVSDAIQPSHPLCRPLLLLPPIPPSIRVFSNESTLPMRWPKYWSFSFSIIPSKEILQNGLVGSPCSPRDSQESSPTPQFKSINSSALSFLHSPTLISIHDHWKNHSLD